MGDSLCVTVVILTFKRPSLLKRAIQSVLDQTYPHFKLHVCDDASGDETGEMVAKMAKFDPRIFYHCNEQNLGVAGNVVQAMEKVSSPFFATLADDDYFAPSHLETALRGFDQYPEAILSVNQTISLNHKRQIHKVTLFENCRDGLYAPPEGLLFLIKNDPSILPAAVLRREVLDKVGCYDPEVVSISDWDYIFRIAVQFPFVVNKAPGCVFFMNETGFSGSAKSQFLWPQWYKMFQKIVGHPNLNLDAKKLVEIELKKRLKRILVTQGKKAVLCGNYSEAKKSADVLNDFFQSKRRALKLLVLAFICKWFPPIRWYMQFFEKVRAKRKLLIAKDRYCEYQQLASYFPDEVSC